MAHYEDTALVIPVLNEKENMQSLIPQLLQTLPGVTILIVDDNSTDGTGDVVKAYSKKFPTVHLCLRTALYGYGPSILEGLGWAREKGFQKVFTMDADFSHDFHAIPAMRALLDTHMFVLGSRYVRGGGIRNWGLRRRLLSKFANWYVRTILQIPFFDVTTGFVGYRPAAIDSIIKYHPCSSGYAFLVETKYILHKNKMSVGEYPIIFTDRVWGTSKMSLNKIWESIWMPWRLRRKH